MAACNSASAPAGKPAAPVAPVEDHELHIDIATGVDGLRVKVIGHAAQLDHAPIADLIGMPASGTADVAIDVVPSVSAASLKGRGVGRDMGVCPCEGDSSLSPQGERVAQPRPWAGAK